MRGHLQGAQDSGVHTGGLREVYRQAAGGVYNILDTMHGPDMQAGGGEPSLGTYRLMPMRVLLLQV